MGCLNLKGISIDFVHYALLVNYNRDKFIEWFEPGTLPINTPIVYSQNQRHPPPKPMMHIPYSPHVSAKFINSLPILTMMQLCITLNPYWMPMRIIAYKYMKYTSLRQNFSARSGIRAFLMKGCHVNFELLTEITSLTALFSLGLSHWKRF